MAFKYMPRKNCHIQPSNSKKPVPDKINWPVPATTRRPISEPSPGVAHKLISVQLSARAWVNGFGGADITAFD